MVSEDLLELTYLIEETGIRKERSETVNEYLERMGERADVDPDVVDAVKRAFGKRQFARDPEITPEEDEAVRELYRQLGRPASSEQDDAGEGEHSNAERSTDATDASDRRDPDSVAGDSENSAGSGPDRAVSEPTSDADISSLRDLRRTKSGGPLARALDRFAAYSSGLGARIRRWLDRRDGDE